MTFNQFESLFKEKYPNGKVWMHDSKNNKVCVDFDVNNSRKFYEYQGSYVDVLRRIGYDKICYEHDLQALKSQYNRYVEKPFIKSFTGKIIDRTSEIKELKEQIEQIEKTYIIVK